MFFIILTVLPLSLAMTVFLIGHSAELLETIKIRTGELLIGITILSALAIILNLIYYDNQEEILCASHCPNGYTLDSKCQCLN